MHSWLWLAKLTTALDMVQMDIESIFGQVHHRKDQWFKDQIGSREVLRLQEYTAVIQLDIFERTIKYMNKKEAEQKHKLA